MKAAYALCEGFVSLRKLEIGIVYKLRRGETFYLAVGRSLLVTVQGGKIRERRSSGGLTKKPTLSVNALLDAWRCSEEMLDQITTHYFAPLAARNVGRRQRNRRRPGSADAELADWVAFRQHKTHPGSA